MCGNIYAIVFLRKNKIKENKASNQANNTQNIIRT